MDILSNGIEFDVRELPAEHRADLNPGVTHMLLGYNRYNNKIISTYFKGTPTYEEPEKILRLNHEKWIEYQLIKHLPPETIYKHFFGEI